MLLLCARRPLMVSGTTGSYAGFRFGEPDRFGIVGESTAIWRLRQELAAVAPRAGHVLLRGQSGVGKELAARAIHELSGRSQKPLVARNAATFPESLVDAELFGNRRDYPNKGMPERPGVIGQADGSTLFLDEIAELSQGLQAHLLRVLDGGDYQRLGESVSRTANLRLIAATNRAKSELRSDFLARFTFQVELPDLDARREDIPLLARFLIRRMATTDPAIERRVAALDSAGQNLLSLELCKQIVERSYSTNVRELDRLLWQSVLQNQAGPLQPVRREASGDGDDIAADAPELQTAEIAAFRKETALPEKAPHTESGPPSALHVKQALDRNNGSLEKTWRELGLASRFVLNRLIAKYHIAVTRRPSSRNLRRSR
jgi:transcriptional regulator with GAF, ATPase, and Fis domain